MTREGKIILVVYADEGLFNYRSDIEIFRLISARNTTNIGISRIISPFIHSVANDFL